MYKDYNAKVLTIHFYPKMKKTGILNITTSTKILKIALEIEW